MPQMAKVLELQHQSMNILPLNFLIIVILFLLFCCNSGEGEIKAGEKATTENEMVGWHHRLNGHEFEQAPGIGNGQEGLVCCRPWGRRVGHD